VRTPALRTRPRAVSTGVTLVELMVVAAVVSIIAAVAVPSYAEYARRTARSDAQMTLLQASTWLERRYVECNSYSVRDASTDPPCTTAMDSLPTELTRSPTTGTTRYTITLTIDSAQAYTIRAVPVIADSKCGTLTINGTGGRGESGTESIDYCWRR
jgi:type IV pilus assembly protein PilE